MAKRTFNRPPSGYTQYPSETLPERWPLATLTQPRNISYNRDARLINCYVELDPQTQEYLVEKRPGVAQPLNLGSGEGRGIFNWRPNTGPIGAGGVYSIVGAQIFKNAVLFGAVSGAGSYVFEPMLEGPYVFFNNSLEAYYTDGTTLTTVTDPDFPTGGFCLGAAYLNQRMYIIRYDAGIQGSDAGNPGAWDPLNLIFARNNPDGGVTIAKQLSYIIALKQWTTEFFEDVGNPTGSVLQVVDGAMLNYGCSDARTLHELDGTLFWVTASKDGAPQVGRLDNLTFKIISTPPIERLLKSVANFAIIDVSAFSLKLGGHRFYVLNIETIPFTLVYDLDQNFWYYWNDPSGIAWPYGSSTLLNDQILLQRVSNGTQVTCDADYVYPTDLGSSAVVDIYTPNFDFGVNRVKQLNMKYFNSDQTTGSVLQVRYSDDDYQTYSNFRLVDLGLIRPSLDNEGSFQRRSYNYRHVCPTALRLRSCDLQIDIGTG